MLELTRVVAQQLNLQYDKDTNHGLTMDAQKTWESEVMQQFQELRTHRLPRRLSQEMGKKNF